MRRPTRLDEVIIALRLDENMNRQTFVSDSGVLSGRYLQLSNRSAHSLSRYRD